MVLTTTMMQTQIKNIYLLFIQLNHSFCGCFPSSCSIHKSLRCWSHSTRNGHQPFPDQWQSSSCRCVRAQFNILHLKCFCFTQTFVLLLCNSVTLPISFVICQSIQNLLLVCVCCGYVCTLTVHTCCVCLVASFGTGSMSMPAGFGNASSYCLPTSFSGNFQQQFPGQAPIPYSQPGAYHPQSNGQWSSTSLCPLTLRVCAVAAINLKFFFACFPFFVLIYITALCIKK